LKAINDDIDNINIFIFFENITVTSLLKILSNSMLMLEVKLIFFLDSSGALGEGTSYLPVTGL